MKIIRINLFFMSLLLNSVITIGQDIKEIEKKIGEYLKAGDCEMAQIYYDRYKASAEKSVKIEADIEACKNSPLDESWRKLIDSAMSYLPAHPDQRIVIDKYKGQSENKNKTRNGFGAYLLLSGDFYFGKFRNNKCAELGIYLSKNFNDIIPINRNCFDCKIYTGGWSEGKMSGKGRCYDKTGKLIYEGVFEADSPKGTYPSTTTNDAYKFEVIHDETDVYLGETKDGKRHGYGIYLRQNGDMWYGEWADDQRTGEGIVIYMDGNMKVKNWTGNLNVFDESLMEMIRTAIRSSPTLTRRDGTTFYKGQSKNGEKHGLGAFLSANGDLDFGRFHRNYRKKGTGIEIKNFKNDSEIRNCPDGKIYVGNRSNYAFSGKGRCYDQNGNLIYEGDFKNYKPAGRYPSISNGSLTFQVIKFDNDIYLGEIKNGRRHGMGICLYQNGEIWYGEWINDNRAGEGILIYSNGKSLRTREEIR